MDKLFDDKQWISPSIFLPSPSLKRPPASALVLMVSKKKYNFIAVHKPAQFSLKSELLLDSWHNDEEEVWRQKSLWKMLRDFPMMMPNTSDSGKHADERRKDEKLSRNNKKNYFGIPTFQFRRAWNVSFVLKMLASCQAPFTAISNSEGEKDEKKKKSYSRRWCRFWILTSMRRFLRHEELGERWDVCKLCCWWFVLVYSLFFMAQWWQGKRQFARMWNAITREMWRWKSVRIRIYITIGNSFFLPHRCNNLRGISSTAVVRLCVLRHSLSLSFSGIFSFGCLHFVYSGQRLHIAMYHLANVCARLFLDPLLRSRWKSMKSVGVIAVGQTFCSLQPRTLPNASNETILSAFRF